MAAERPLAPFGRRLARVGESHDTGGYRLFTLIDEEGPPPAPGQFYMLTGAEWQGDSGRPFLPRAISVARHIGERGKLRLEFLIDEVGPGTVRLGALSSGDSCWIAGPFGSPFSMPKELNPGAAGAILVGGGIGIAPMAVLRRHLVSRGVPTRTLLGFRDLRHSGWVEELFGCEETRLAYEDGHGGSHKGYVTDLLLRMLGGDDPGGAAVYACGPPAMLEAVRLICGEADVPVELALESPMACGFGACYGCAVPKAEGGYLRLCVDGPVVRGDEIKTAMAGESADGPRP